MRLTLLNRSVLSALRGAEFGGAAGSELDDGRKHANLNRGRIRP